MRTGWLVNDCLTCIPGTKTFWHDLLEWFPELIDMTKGSMGFGGLAKSIEQQVNREEPDFIIRNASYFRRLNLKVRTISFLQDCFKGSTRTQQLDVCNHSDIVVCNSQFIRSQYESEVTSRIEIVSIGTDFEFFHPLLDKNQLCDKWGIPENSILFIGSTHPIKGFNVIQSLIANTDYNFCLVMKDDFKIDNSRVKIFNRIDHKTIAEIINCCVMLICPSVVETFHLAGVEAMACGLPVLATDVGVYYGWNDGLWGRKVKEGNFLSGVEDILGRLNSFSSRKYASEKGLGREQCKRKWKSLLEEIK